jgi:hypothetical protein
VTKGRAGREAFQRRRRVTGGARRYRPCSMQRIGPSFGHGRSPGAIRIQGEASVRLRFTRISCGTDSLLGPSNSMKGDDTMKRIIAVVLVGGLSALTLAAAPAHAEERSYDGRDGVHQEYDRRAPPSRRPDRRDRHARDQRDEDTDRRDGYGRYDGYPQPEQQPYRRAGVGVGMGNVDVRTDVGSWLAHG